MDAQIWVSLALALIALAALYFTGLSTMTARQQTRIQGQLAKDAAQPYVWADLRPDDPQQGLMLLVVGNAGPTVATGVTVTIEPEPPDLDRGQESTIVHRLRSPGLASIAPGRVIRWELGAAHEHLPTDEPVRYTITVNGVGPFGALRTLTYDVDLRDIRESWAVGDGSLRLVSKSIDQMTETLKRT